MKYNGVVTNIPQYDPDNGGFTDEEKALGRKNIGAGGISVIERDSVPVASGDLVLGRRTGGSMREISVNLRDPDNGDTLAGYLVPPRTSNNKSLICDASGNIAWGDQPSALSAGDNIYIDDNYHINVTGLQEQLQFDYTPDSAISAINGSPLVGGGGSGEALHYSAGEYVNIAGLVISVTGLQPSGNYIEQTEFDSGMSAKLDSSAYTAPVQSDWNQSDETQLDYIKNKPTIPSLAGYATEEYVDSAVSGKLDSSAYHEYSEGEHIGIQSGVISVTGLENLSAGPNVDIYEVDGHYEISAAGTGGGSYNPGQYIYIDEDFNTINVSGLQPAGDYAYASAMSAYSTNEYVNNNFAYASALSAYSTKTYVDNSVNSATSGKLNISAYTAPVQSDWTEDDTADLAYIKNKPVEIGLIAGSGIYLEDMTSAVKISCSVAPSQSTLRTGSGSVNYNSTGDTQIRGEMSSCKVYCSISTESYCQIKVIPNNSATITCDQSTIKSINGNFDSFRIYNYPWNNPGTEMLTGYIPYDSNNNGTIEIDLFTNEPKLIHLTIWYRADTTNGRYDFQVVEKCFTDDTPSEE